MGAIVISGKHRISRPHGELWIVCSEQLWEKYTYIYGNLINIRPLQLLSLHQLLLQIFTTTTFIHCRFPPNIDACTSFTQPGHIVMFHSWWRHDLHTFSALLVFCMGNSPVTGGFLPQRPVTRSFDVFDGFFYLRLNQQLSKQWVHRLFVTPWRSLWRHNNLTYEWGLDHRITRLRTDLWFTKCEHHYAFIINYSCFCRRS